MACVWSPGEEYTFDRLNLSIIESSNLIEYLKGEDVPIMKIKGTRHNCGGQVDFDSWHWITKDVVAFSGGACGTFIDYLFYADKQRLETYCAALQKPRYGCPFSPHAEYLEKIKLLKKSDIYSKGQSAISKEKEKNPG